MLRATVYAVCVVVALAASGDGKVDDPKFKSAGAKKAADAFNKEVARLEDKYRKGLDQARAEYVKVLSEARKEAIKANNLEEAERIVATIKDADEATAKKMATVRQRVAGSVWEWSQRDYHLTLHADGTVSLTWHKDATGNWYVNPDGTVAWWCTKHNFVVVMRFNANFTAHESHTPTVNELNRSGKRVK